MGAELMTPHDRADSVEDLIASFASWSGLAPSPDGDGPETMAGDLISNILHWVKRETGKAECAAGAARDGLAHFIVEHDGEEGPDARVQIVAMCRGEVWVSWTGRETTIQRPA